LFLFAEWSRTNKLQAVSGKLVLSQLLYTHSLAHFLLLFAEWSNSGQFLAVPVKTVYSLLLYTPFLAGV